MISVGYFIGMDESRKEIYFPIGKFLNLKIFHYYFWEFLLTFTYWDSSHRGLFRPTGPHRQILFIKDNFV